MSAHRFSDLTVLCIDDDRTQVEKLTSILSDVGIRNIDVVLTDSDYSERASNNRFDIVFVDVKLAGKDGFKVINKISEHHVDAKLVIVSEAGWETLHEAVRVAEAHGLSVCGVLEKPFTKSDLEVFLIDACT